MNTGFKRIAELSGTDYQAQNKLFQKELYRAKLKALADLIIEIWIELHLTMVFKTLITLGIIIGGIFLITSLI